VNVRNVKILAPDGMMDRNHVLAAVNEPCIHVYILAIALDNISNGYTQVLHRAQEASTSTLVVVKVVIVNTFKRKGMSGLGHLVLSTDLRRDHSRRSGDFL
jgi:predicted acetyltransferase